MRHIKKGDLVIVSFLDHVEDGIQPMRCKVVGRLVSKGKTFAGRKYLVIESWFLTGEVDEETADANSKTWIILSSAIEKVARLQEVEDGVLDKPAVRKRNARTSPSNGQHNGEVRESGCDSTERI